MARMFFLLPQNSKWKFWRFKLLLRNFNLNWGIVTDGYLEISLKNTSWFRHHGHGPTMLYNHEPFLLFSMSKQIARMTLGPTVQRVGGDEDDGMGAGVKSQGGASRLRCGKETTEKSTQFHNPKPVWKIHYSWCNNFKSLPRLPEMHTRSLSLTF